MLTLFLATQFQMVSAIAARPTAVTEQKQKDPNAVAQKIVTDFENAINELKSDPENKKLHIKEVQTLNGVYADLVRISVQLPQMPHNSKTRLVRLSKQLFSGIISILFEDRHDLAEVLIAAMYQESIEGKRIPTVKELSDAFSFIGPKSKVSEKLHKYLEHIKPNLISFYTEYQQAINAGYIDPKALAKEIQVKIDKSENGIAKALEKNIKEKQTEAQPKKYKPFKINKNVKTGVKAAVGVGMCVGGIALMASGAGAAPGVGLATVGLMAVINAATGK